LRDSIKALKEKNVQVIGISMDKVEDQKKFKDKNQLPFPLLSDTDGVLVKAYGVRALSLIKVN
jgi:peroxiredoxin Q/BCP